MENDIHGSQKSFQQLLNRINALPNDSNGQLMRKYLAWHKIQLERGVMTHSSVNRSLSIALLILDKVPNISQLETAPIERFWSETIQRKAIKRSQGKVYEMKKTLGVGSIKKIRSQTIKLYKFAKFLDKYPDKELIFFKASMITRPECCDFLITPQSKKREDFKLPSQEKIKELILELFKSPHYYSKMAGVMVAISNDCGLRFTEMATIQWSGLEKVEDFYLISGFESKSAKRTVICKLSKKFLDEWEKLNKKKEFVFEPIEGDKGRKVVYNSLKKYLILAAKKVGLELPVNKKFHLFRSCCSSRLRQMPENEKHYFMGWRKRGMEDIYTRVTWEDCKEYYFKSLKGNPMVDFPLSDTEEKQVTDLKTEILAEVEAMFLAKRKELRT